MQQGENNRDLRARKAVAFWLYLKQKRALMRWMFYPVFGALILIFFCFVWLSTVGLPAFATWQIAHELNSLGFEFKAQKLKLTWGLGVYASGLSLSPKEEGGAHFCLSDAVLNIGFWRWLQSGNVIGSVQIRQGHLQWPLGEQEGEELELDEIAGVMVFDEVEQDVWTLKNLRGKLLNTEINITGELKNADALARMQLPKKKDRDPEQLKKIKRSILYSLNLLKTFETEASPQLMLRLRLDAEDWMKSSADVIFDLQDLRGSYGAGERFQAQILLADLGSTNGLRSLKLRANLEKASSQRFDIYLDQINFEGTLFFDSDKMLPLALNLEGDANWASNRLFSAHDFHFDLRTGPAPEANSKTRVNLSAQVANLQIDKVGGSDLFEFSAEIDNGWDLEKGPFSLFSSDLFQDFNLEKYQQLFEHPDFPKRLRTSFRLARPQSRWGRTDWLDADITLTNRPPAEYAKWNGPEYGLWRWMLPLGWDMRLNSGPLHIPKPLVRTDYLNLALGWSAPEFEVKKIYSQLHHGELDVAAKLDMESRIAVGAGEMDFDAHQMANLLDAAGQRWIKQFGWEPETPPTVSASAKVKLAEWTNLNPDWNQEVLPWLELKGHVNGTNANFQGIPVLSADGDFCLTNKLWTLPKFTVTRPEGSVVFYYEGDSDTQDYLWDFKSRCNPQALSPILGEGAALALEMFEFTTAPDIEAKLWGRWKDLTKTGLDGKVVAENFVFRGQPLEHVHSSVTFTNGLLRAVSSELRLPPTSAPVSEAEVGEGRTATEPVAGQGIHVEEVTFSSSRQEVTITNAVCRLYPRIITRIIGPETDAVMEHYHFSGPPLVSVDGVIPVNQAEHSHMDFQLEEGVGLRWWKLSPQNLTGLVRWQGEYLSLTNISADFYGGALNGWAAFDFTQKGGADFQFDAEFKNCALKPFINSFNSKPNKLEGLLDGRLIVEKANSADWDSWNGRGSASITNGLIWDIPIFGLFSDLLNEVSPGLGNSQASRGGGTFTMTDSVILTDDLEIASPTFQMLYKGTIDFNRNLDAVVDMDILKGWGDVGKAINFMATPLRRVFRSSVKGTFEEPELEFVYIPKPFMIFMRPLKTIKDLLKLNKAAEVNDLEPKE